MPLHLHEIVDTHRRVSATRKRLEKIRLLAACLKQAALREVAVAVAYLAGELPQGRLGVGPAMIRAAWPDSAAGAPSLTVAQVHEALEAISEMAGPGSTSDKMRALHDLMRRGTADEQEFLARLVFGELRQGALEGIMVEAVARAAGAPAGDVRRAVMLAGELPRVAHAAMGGGPQALSSFGVRVFRPLKPMLAQSAERVADAMERLGTAGLEFKLDGARVQVHKAGRDVRVFTRKLNDVTHAVPELVDSVRDVPAAEIVLDGEILALREDGTPYPFQTTMSRFGRKFDVARMRETLPLSTWFFDCLYVDGDTLVDEGGAHRFGRLVKVVPPSMVVPRLVTGDADAGRAFLRQAREAGHEGLVVKALDAPYEAGRRGASWIKVKQALTLDLVVLAAEWGSGRRKGWLSNLHLGARDPDSGGFVMLGKTFKGMTDQVLEWQTRALQEIETSRTRYTVHVEPRLVVEIAFNDVQASPRYPGGLALRFARLRSYRLDKRPEDADTIQTVRALYAGQVGEPAP